MQATLVLAENPVVLAVISFLVQAKHPVLSYQIVFVLFLLSF
jgi:hypothetical protein